MDQFYQTVKRRITEYEMIHPGDTVLAGLSGGADSVCLLLILSRLRRELLFELVAVHINHKVRREAMEDGIFSENLCKTLSCTYIYREVEMEKYAQDHHLSPEEAGRILRYRIFYEELDKLGIPKERGKIAVAHNQNDNAETVLFHLFRGSSLTGLRGMTPVRDRIIRPLLGVSRQEIEDYLREKKQPYCTDRTNLEDSYARNRIRHHVLSYVEDQICHGATRHICQAAEDLGEAGEFIRKQAESLWAWCGRILEEGVCLDLKLLGKGDPFLQKQVLMLAVERAAGSRKDIGSVHMEQIMELCKVPGNREIHLPDGLTIRREYEVLFLSKKKPETVKRPAKEVGRLHVPGETDFLGYSFKTSILETFDLENIPEKRYTKWFDYDKIKKCLEIRTRKTGDFLCINEKHARKSLKRYFIDEKIPPSKRDKLLLIAEDSHVIWVSGYRISSYYRVDRCTKRVLQVEITGGIENE